MGRLVDAELVAAMRDESQVGHPNRYRLTAGGLRTLGAASPEELREKLRPSVGALVAADATAEAVPLEEQLAVLTLVAGFGEADVQLIGRALRTSEAECAPLLRQLVTTGMLGLVPAPAGPRYRLGQVGIELLGSEGAAAVRRAAERAGVGASASSMRDGDDHGTSTREHR